MSERIIANNENIWDLVNDAIEKNGPNCDLNFIDVSHVTDMRLLFYESQFNGDISQWDVSKVTYMDDMFADSKFSGDISKWKVSKELTATNAFKNSVLEKLGKIPQWG